MGLDDNRCWSYAFGSYAVEGSSERRVIHLGIEFIGYYTVDGPNGFVVAATKRQAITDAQTITKDWPKAKYGEPYHQKNKRNWSIVIWTQT